MPSASSCPRGTPYSPVRRSQHRSGAGCRDSAMLPDEPAVRVGMADQSDAAIRMIASHAARSSSDGLAPGAERAPSRRRSRARRGWRGPASRAPPPSPPPEAGPRRVGRRGVRGGGRGQIRRLCPPDLDEADPVRHARPGPRRAPPVRGLRRKVAEVGEVDMHHRGSATSSAKRKSKPPQPSVSQTNSVS